MIRTVKLSKSTALTGIWKLFVMIHDIKIYLSALLQSFTDYSNLHFEWTVSNNTESLNSTIQSTGLEIKQVDIKDILDEDFFFFWIAAISIKQHTDGAEYSGVNITRLSSPVAVQTSISDKTVLHCKLKRPNPAT